MRENVHQFMIAGVVRFIGFIRESLVVGEKVYAVKYMEKVFITPLMKVNGEEKTSSKLGIVIHCCVNDKLLYVCDSFGNIFWRKLDDLEWKKVKGLEDLRKLFPRSDAYYVRGIPSYDMLSRCYSKLISFGVNIVIVWFKYNYKKMDIWCAEISFERRKEKGVVWGTVKWSEVVVTPDHDIYNFEVLYFSSVNV